MKIDGQMDRIPQRDLRAASGELAAFYIFPPKAKQTRRERCSPPTRRWRPGWTRSPGSRPSSREPVTTAPHTMGLLEILTGKRKLAKPAEDRLFAISTAYVTFETSLEITSRGQRRDRLPVAGDRRLHLDRRDMEEVVRATAADSAHTVETSEDSYGFSWLILRGQDFDSLVVGINAVSSALQDGGYGERVLCAVFAFQDARRRPLYLIYNYKRGSFYPFVPAAGRLSSETTSASWCSGPRPPTSCRSSRTCSAGFRCGESPSERDVRSRVWGGRHPRSWPPWRCATLRRWLAAS